MLHSETLVPVAYSTADEFLFVSPHTHQMGVCGDAVFIALYRVSERGNTHYPI